MKDFKVRKGTFLKSKNNVTNMMYTVLMILVVFIIFSVYKNGIYPVVKGYGNLYLVFKPIFYPLVAALTSIFTEYIYYVIKKDKKSIYELFTEEFAIIPGIFLGLIVGINTPVYILIIGAIISSLSKVLMGGFGNNKLNPAIVGAIFVIVVFSSLVGTYSNPYELELVGSKTPIANMKATDYLITYDNLVKPYGNLFDFFFGSIPGPLGITSAFLSIIALIYLMYKKIVKWRITISYILSVIVISLIVCLNKDIGLWFILFNLLSEGLIFIGVLMATEPVTSPISHLGQVTGGSILGILTMIIRYLTPLSEAVLISVLIYNIITLLINYLTIKLYGKDIIKKIIVIGTILLCILSSFIVSKNITITQENENKISVNRHIN